MKYRTILFATALALLASTASKAATPGTLCSPNEEVIFSCKTTRAKIVSVCASPSLADSGGYIQYRFGTADKPELIYPSAKRNPRQHFTSGTLTYSGGGGAYIQFRNGAYNYIVFTGIGRGWEKDGGGVEKAGHRLSEIKCANRAQSEIGPDLFERAQIPEHPDSNFEIP